MHAIISEIGKRIRQQRISQKLTLQEVADIAGITKGLLSKIENGRSIPSLPVFIAVVSALKARIEDVFPQRHDGAQKKFIHIPSGHMMAFEKEGAEGYHYYFIYNKVFAESLAEIVVLEIDPFTTRKTVTTDASEIKYMLEGEVEYEIDGEFVNLKKGDCLIFNGMLPHVPHNQTPLPARMLVLYLYHSKSILTD